MKPTIVYFSSETGSIGEVTQTIILGLKDKFNFVPFSKFYFEDAEQYDVLVHFVGADWIYSTQTWKNANRRILIQPIDGTAFTNDFKKEIKRFDVLITPSSACFQILRDNNIKLPIWIVPNCCEPIESEDTSVLDKLEQYCKGKVVFYHESTHHARKGTDLMYKAFAETFNTKGDEVILISKDDVENTHTFDSNANTKKSIIKRQNQSPNPPTIIKINQRLPIAKLAQLWQLTDIYIGLSFMEGFGIPHLRMAQLGKPIVAVKGPYQGYCDFLNSDNAYLAKGIEERVDSEFMNIYEESKCIWAKPTFEDVQKQLIMAFGDFVLGKSKRVSKEDLQYYSKTNVLSLYERIFKQTNIEQ